MEIERLTGIHFGVDIDDKEQKLIIKEYTVFCGWSSAGHELMYSVVSKRLDFNGEPVLRLDECNFLLKSGQTVRIRPIQSIVKNFKNCVTTSRICESDQSLEEVHSEVGGFLIKDPELVEMMKKHFLK